MRTRRIRQFRRQAVTLSADYAAPLRRWLGRGLTRIETRVFYALEHQRINQGHIRINIVDRDNVDSCDAIRTYLAWLAHIDRRFRDIAVLAPTKSQAQDCARRLNRRNRSISSFPASALGHYPLRGQTYCAAVFFDAQLYGMSPNLVRSIFSVIPSDGVIIIHSRKYRIPLPPVYEPDILHSRPQAKPPEQVDVDVALNSDSVFYPPPDPPPQNIISGCHKRRTRRQLPPHLSIRHPPRKSSAAKEFIDLLILTPTSPERISCLNPLLNPLGATWGRVGLGPGSAD